MLNCGAHHSYRTLRIRYSTGEVLKFDETAGTRSLVLFAHSYARTRAPLFVRERDATRSPSRGSWRT